MNWTVIGIELFFGLVTAAVLVGLALVPIVLVLVELQQMLLDLGRAS